MVDSTNETAVDTETTSRRWTLQRVITIVAVVIILLIVLIFVIALVAAIAAPEGAAGIFSYVKDLMTIVLLVQGILIVIALAVLITQIARFVNLLRSEVSPIMKDAQQTVQDVRTSAQFVGKHTTRPIIVLSSFFSGLLTFTTEILRINRLMRRRPQDDNSGS